jgi:hypothetical protein
MVPLPFSRRQTASVAVFSCIFVASPMQGAGQFTSDVPTITALQLDYAQLINLYPVLIRQDVPDQRATLYAAIAHAVTIVGSLNTTVQSIMAVSNDPNRAQLAVMQSITASALASLKAVQSDEVQS